MKDFSAIWLIVSLFVLPCTLDLERLGCIVIVMANIIASFIVFRKYNKEYINF